MPLVAAAQPPAGYYNGAFGKNGEALRAALYNIIRANTTVLNYAGSTQPNTWTAFQSTDKKPDGKLWDIYSDIPGGTPSYEYDFSQKCGNGSNHENSCYNHEHVWPQSKFNQSLPMRSDLWVAYPTDYYVNGQRGDLPYGKVTAPAKTFTNGTKIGPNTYTGAPSGSAFEPIDSFKGDIARSYFYITTRYYGDSASFVTSGGVDSWEMAVKSTLKPWVIQMLMEWHHMDPVSSKEIARNNAAYGIQGNRNPFIDYPQFADCIWLGNCTGLSVAGVAPVASHIHAYPNPAASQVQISWEALAADEVQAVDVMSVQGQLMFHTTTGASKSVIIPVSEWAKGMYLLQVKTQHGTQAQKLAVQ